LGTTTEPEFISFIFSLRPGIQENFDGLQTVRLNRGMNEFLLGQYQVITSIFKNFSQRISLKKQRLVQIVNSTDDMYTCTRIAVFQ
jgi:hypothetical protein